MLFLLQLQCVEGNILVASGENKMEVPFLKPDEQGELAVPFIAPATPGHYERYVTCTCVVTIRVTHAIFSSNVHKSLPSSFNMILYSVHASICLASVSFCNFLQPQSMDSCFVCLKLLHLSVRISLIHLYSSELSNI